MQHKCYVALFAKLSELHSSDIRQVYIVILYIYTFIEPILTSTLISLSLLNRTKFDFTLHSHT